MLTPHPSANIEYWFFKVNSGPVALIVDWIERRKLKERFLRVSIHSPYKREVIFEKLTSFMPNDNFIDIQKTVGHAGEVAWDLNIDLGRDVIKPDIFPSNALKMTDIIITSAPLARFTGWIRHGSQQVNLQSEPGMVSQYWGRQLSLEWWWISAHHFDREDVSLECVVGKSSLWGMPVSLSLSYLYLHYGDGREYFVRPGNSTRVTGSPEKFQIEINRIGKEKITLTGTGREYSDFGDRIINTLTGDLEVREGKRVIAHAHGTAGLERRYSPSEWLASFK